MAEYKEVLLNKENAKVLAKVLGDTGMKKKPVDKKKPAKKK